MNLKGFQLKKQLNICINKKQNYMEKYMPTIPMVVSVVAGGLILAAIFYFLNKPKKVEEETETVETETKG